MTARPFDWTDLLGQHRTIAIHTPVLEWAGDYHAAALFEELVWRWNEAGRAEFAATDADLQAKLYLTRGALRGARKRLADLKAVATVARGMPPILRYTVTLSAFNQTATDADLGESNQSSVQNSPIIGAEFATRVAEIEPTSISQNGSESKDRVTDRIAPTVGAPGATAAPAPLVSPAHAEQPTVTGATVNGSDRTPPVPPPPPKRQRKPAAPKADPQPRERDPFFDAFCRAFALGDGGGRKAGLAGEFSVSCKREGATLDQFRQFYAANRTDWGKYGCQPHAVTGSFLAWRIGQGMAGDPIAPGGDTVEIDGVAVAYDQYNVKHYLARKAEREGYTAPPPVDPSAPPDLPDWARGLSGAAR